MTTHEFDASEESNSNAERAASLAGSVAVAEGMTDADWAQHLETQPYMGE
jgi:hypothetical protein